jgi:hypothetical protein
MRSHFALQIVSWAIGLPLELLVIAAMVRGAARQFPLLFAYAVIEFLLTVAGLPSYFAYYSGELGARDAIANWFLVDELILQPLIYAVVISLIYKASETARSRRTTGAALILGAVAIAGISLLIHYDPTVPKGSWLAFWTRDLNLFATILDLGLWAILLASKQRDLRLLMISGGLGVQFTGEAIGNSLRSMAVRYHSVTMSWAGGLIATVADLAYLYVLWQAFRKTVPESSAAATLGMHHK